MFGVQLFRKDLISAMKLPDTEVLQYDEYFLIGDTWKLEWERGVQVPVDIDAIPPLVIRSVPFFLILQFCWFACFNSILDFHLEYTCSLVECTLPVNDDNE